MATQAHSDEPKSTLGPRHYFAALLAIIVIFLYTNAVAGDPAESWDASCDRAWTERVSYLTAIQTGRPADRVTFEHEWLNCYPLDPTVQGP